MASRTIVEGDLNKNVGSTKIETAGGGSLPTFSTPSASSNRAEIDLAAANKTQIFRPDNQTVNERRLIGWLYTFSRKTTGEFFVLYEGKNTIGSSKDNDIVLDDPSVSANHCYILHRANTKSNFLKDEGSTNGTFINGEELFDAQKAVTDGDEIKIASITCGIRLVKEALPSPAMAQNK